MPKVVVVEQSEFSDLSAEESAAKALGASFVVVAPGADASREVVDADIILTGEAYIDPGLIASTERCKAIVAFGIGFDHIDLEACNEAGIVIVNHPGVWTDEVSTHAVSLLLAFSRQLVLANDRLRRREGWMPELVALQGSEATLRDATLGIVGFGRIGRMVARKMAPFGLNLLVHDPYIDPEVPKEYGGLAVPFGELLANSDFVSVHTPLTKETTHLFDEAAFAAIKPGAVFINTARGRIQDEKALLKALESGRLRGAGLDVFEVEPVESDNPLIGRPDVIATPHSAYYSPRSVAGLHVRIGKAMEDVLNGRLPYNVANPEVIGRTRIERAR